MENLETKINSNTQNVKYKRTNKPNYFIDNML